MMTRSASDGLRAFVGHGRGIDEPVHGAYRRLTPEACEGFGFVGKPPHAGACRPYGMGWQRMIVSLRSGHGYLALGGAALICDVEAGAGLLRRCALRNDG